MKTARILEIGGGADAEFRWKEKNLSEEISYVDFCRQHIFPDVSEIVADILEPNWRVFPVYESEEVKNLQVNIYDEFFETFLNESCRERYNLIMCINPDPKLLHGLATWPGSNFADYLKPNGYFYLQGDGVPNLKISNLTVKPTPEWCFPFSAHYPGWHNRVLWQKSE